MSERPGLGGGPAQSSLCPLRPQCQAGGRDGTGMEQKGRLGR